MPKTTLIVGEYDGVRNDTELLYLKLKEAQQDVNKIVIPGQTHCTILLREIMRDGPDPAQVIAEQLA